MTTKSFGLWIGRLLLVCGCIVCSFVSIGAFSDGNIRGGLFYSVIVSVSMGLLIGSELYGSYIPVEMPLKTQSPAVKAINRAGYVYLLRTLHDPRSFKIGRTKDPENRIKTFATKFPFKVQYACLIYTMDMFALEKELHKRFASQRLDGEFFRLSESDVTYIKSLGETP